jgi:hypothetical protein
MGIKRRLRRRAGFASPLGSRLCLRPGAAGGRSAGHTDNGQRTTDNGQRTTESSVALRAAFHPCATRRSTDAGAIRQAASRCAFARVLSSVAGYPQVGIWLVRSMIAARSSKLDLSVVLVGRSGVAGSYGPFFAGM